MAPTDSPLERSSHLLHRGRFSRKIQSDRVAAAGARSRLQGSLCASLSVELAGRIPMRSVDAVDVDFLDDLTATSQSILTSDVAGQDGV